MYGLGVMIPGKEIHRIVLSYIAEDDVLKLEDGRTDVCIDTVPCTKEGKASINTVTCTKKGSKLVTCTKKGKKLVSCTQKGKASIDTVPCTKEGKTSIDTVPILKKERCRSIQK